MFEEEGLERYVALQLELEDQPFTPGVSFPFVKVTTGLSTTIFFFFFKQYVGCLIITLTLPPSAFVRNLMAQVMELDTCI